MVNNISEGIHIVGSAKSSAGVVFSKKKEATHTNFKHVDEQGLIDGRWLPWGDNNLYPQDFAKKLKRTGIAVGGLEVLTAAHFGSGLQLYQAIEGETSLTFKERLVSSFPEISEFYKKTKLNIFFSDVVLDFETFRVSFPEYVLSPNGEYIISVRRIQAANCRFEKPDTNGMINNIGINTDWENYKKENTAEIPCFASHIPLEDVKAYCKEKDIERFTIPEIDSLLIEKSYPSVGWHSSFKNGWVDVILSIPAFKKAMFEKQLNVKYLIHIADDYFAHVYKDQWHNWSDEEQNKKRQELTDLIDDKMSGNDSAGKSLISPYFRDESGKEIKGVQIEEIPQPQANGDFLMDNSAANYELLTGMGVDPCLINGGTFGGKSLSGSGSDKREAWTILCAKMPLKQIRTLQIFENIKQWNGWDETVFAKFPGINLTTLDKNPDGQVKIVN